MLVIQARTWSLLGSELVETQAGYVANGDPLRFIHFSGLDSGTIDKAIGWWLTDDNRAWRDVAGRQVQGRANRRHGIHMTRRV